MVPQKDMFPVSNNSMLGHFNDFFLLFSKKNSPKFHSMHHWAQKIAVIAFIFVFLSRVRILLTQMGILPNLS